ncbi:hypothetical protein [Agromyces sp. NPDC055658]
MSGTERDLDETVAAARHAAERAADRAGEVTEDLVDEAGDRLDDLGDRVENVADAVGDVMSDVRRSATEAVETIGTQASVVAGEAREVLDDGVAYVKARYREHPAAVIALGAAVVVGVCLVVKALTRR